MTEKKIRGKIFVVSAPSGAGKTTLLNRLMEQIPDLVYSVSATTRKPRRGERDGEHYFFMSKEEFENRIKNGEFAEWELVHGNYYGTPKNFIDSVIYSSRHIILDIDVFGKKRFDKVYPDNTGILIVAPSMEELQRRLKSRNTDRPQDIETRLRNAQIELEFARNEGRYEYEIVNDDLESAGRRLFELVKAVIVGG